jgi:hypothetical protein
MECLACGYKIEKGSYCYECNSRWEEYKELLQQRNEKLIRMAQDLERMRFANDK